MYFALVYLFFSRNPIPVWHATSSDNIPKIFLLGDAAHPPVPYIGQGAMVSSLYIDISKLTKSTLSALYLDGY